MPNQFIISKQKSIYLDTSFVLSSLYDSIDSNPHIVGECNQILWLLFAKENANCYISNIVINELFNVIERTWFQVYMDTKIISILNISKEEWVSYSKKYREKFENLWKFSPYFLFLLSGTIYAGFYYREKF